MPAMDIVDPRVEAYMGTLLARHDERRVAEIDAEVDALELGDRLLYIRSADEDR